MPTYSDDDDDASGDGGAKSAPQQQPAISRTVDDDTLRIMLSTDNHLGYAERDPVRGEKDRA
jgi:double-strand break repair protein MRE11